MSRITTHILDTSKGRPAAGVPVRLFCQDANGWTELASGVTNNDGRVSDWLAAKHLPGAGIYKIYFDTQAYFSNDSTNCFYPFVEIVFNVTAGEHYHVPLLLSPFGYSTYRGS